MLILPYLLFYFFHVVKSCVSIKRMFFRCLFRRIFCSHKVNFVMRLNLITTTTTL
ncbi:hypothetical protein MBAV_000441 [Candidatus Magnetobacterium bavaricum]|uniref:Uncharacterized protein n=1 Tax=Candidatus Magnetobacterium bavaricum TaxID=29290 RepID=A0A0F3H367_9BACT|nr:hypothetical protein MBAV_000441 [Candidatus Magnetobacterium bavaricum]